MGSVGGWSLMARLSFLDLLLDDRKAWSIRITISFTPAPLFSFLCLFVMFCLIHPYALWYILYACMDYEKEMMGAGNPGEAKGGGIRRWLGWFLRLRYWFSFFFLSSFDTCSPTHIGGGLLARK